MERRLASKIRDSESAFKDSIKEWLHKNSCSVNESDGSNNTAEFLQFVYDFEPLKLTTTDFMRRKRVKNDAPFYERCTARRADGEQCTRRKRGESVYCGTHMKGTPHGVIDSTCVCTSSVKKINVWLEDIKGILYNIDSNGNVYDPNDIVSGKNNPNIIAQYVKSDTGEYSIPTLTS